MTLYPDKYTTYFFVGAVLSLSYCLENTQKVEESFVSQDYSSDSKIHSSIQKKSNPIAVDFQTFTMNDKGK